MNIVLWYRPPCYNEVSSINDLFPECEKHGKESIGTIIIGALNVHHKLWLQFSNGISPEGRVYLKNVVFKDFNNACANQLAESIYWI